MYIFSHCGNIIVHVTIIIVIIITIIIAFRIMALSLSLYWVCQYRSWKVGTEAIFHHII